MTDKELLIYWRDDRAGKAEATLNEIKPIIRQLKHFGCFSGRADSLIDVIDKILFPIQDEKQEGEIPLVNTSDIDLDHAIHGRRTKIPTPPDDHTPVDLSHDEPDPIMDQDTSAPLGKLKKPDEKCTCHLGGGEGSPRNCPACNPTPQTPKEGELVWYGAGHVMDWTYDADDMADITGPVKPDEVVQLRIAMEGLAAIKNGSVWNRYATPQKIAEKALEAIGATVTIERSDDE